MVLVGSDGCVLRSTDRGQGFERARTDVSQALFGVAVLGDATAVVAVGAQGLVLRSQDGAQSFERRQSGVTTDLRQLARAGEGSLLAVGDAGTVLSSSDDGHTFRRENTGVSDNLAHAVPLPNGAGFLIGGEHGLILRGKPGGPWQRLTLGVDSVVTCMTLRPDGVALIASESGQVFRLAAPDRFEVAFASSAEDGFVTSLSNGDAGVTIATTRGGGVWSAHDGGTRWSAIAVPTREYLGVSAFDARSQSFLVAGNRGVVFESDRGRAKFEQLPSNTTEDVHTLVCGPESGVRVAAGRGGFVARARSAGSALEPIALGVTQYLHALLSESREHLLVAVGSGASCVRSSDGGRKWSRVALPIAENTTLYAVAEHSPSGALLVAGSGGALLRSEDRARTFSRVAATEQSISAIHLHGERLLLLSLDEGVHYSDDAGRSFTRAALDGSPSLLTLGVIDDKTLLAGGMGGVILRSSDAGKSWSARWSGTQVELRGFARDGNGDVWLAGAKGTLLHSKDAGEHFEPVASGTEQNLSALLWHDASRTLFAAGNDGTLLRVSREGCHAVSVPTKERLRILSSEPGSGALVVAGTGGVVLRARDVSRPELVFTHTGARFSSSAFHAPTNAWVFAGERILWLPTEHS
ncbi:MAG: hypothetical protein QM756_34130 [Polyangiaceae bacterium]